MLSSSPLTSLAATSIQPSSEPIPPPSVLSKPITITKTYGRSTAVIPSDAQTIPETDFSENVVIADSELLRSTTSSSTSDGHHTTDPTTEEEKGMKSSPTVRRSATIPPDASDSESEVQQVLVVEENSGITRNQKKSVEQMMADYDAAFDSDEGESKASTKVDTPAVFHFDPIPFEPFDYSMPPNPFATQIPNPFNSTTPHQDDLHYPLSHSDQSPTQEPGPSHRFLTNNHQESSPGIALGQQFDEDEEMDTTIQPTGRKSLKSRPKILDSEDENEDDEPVPTKSRRILPTSTTTKSDGASSSGEEELSVTATAPIISSPVLTLTKREKAAALAAKRGAIVEAKKRAKLGLKEKEEREEEREERREEVVGSSEDEIVEARQSKKAARMPKGMNKTEKMDSEKARASLIRGQKVELAQTNKPALSVLNALSKGKISQPLQKRFDPTQKFVHPTSPRESIESDPISSTSGSTLTPRQQGKLRQPSHGLEFDRKEKIPTTQAFVPIEFDQETQAESLLSGRAKFIKSEKSRTFQESKRISLTKMVKKEVSDSDSDIEIVGGPVQYKPKVIPTAATFKPIDTTQRDFQKKVGARVQTHEDSTETQFVRAGRAFHAASGVIVVEPTTKPLIPRKSNAFKPKIKVPTTITGDDLNQILIAKVKKSNAATRQDKTLKSRRDREQTEKAEVTTMQPNLTQILKNKKESLARGGGKEDDIEDDSEDDDYLGSDAPEQIEDEEMGSGSDPEEENKSLNQNLKKSIDTSPLNREVLGEILPEEEDEEKENEPLRGVPSRRRGIVDDEDEEEENISQPITPEVALMPALPARMNLAGFLGEDEEEGFSQFFADDFSQDLGGVNDLEGFKRPVATMGRESSFIAPVLIDAAGRAEDAARLDALGGFRIGDPTTPKTVAPRRQYINAAGFMTQNRPENPFAVSPREGDDLTETLPFESFDTQTQTQLETQSPTRRPKFHSKSSFDERPPSPTEIQEEETQMELISVSEILDEDGQLMLPSAQPQYRPVPKANAFTTLMASALLPAPMARSKLKRKLEGKSEFINDEANLSDEEVMGMGMGNNDSGDEDETKEDMNAELMELVDNQIVDEVEGAEQDALARQRAAEDAAADDAKREIEAQKMVDGKMRNGKRNKDSLGGIGDDDDWDDDYGISHHIKKTRVGNATMESLAADETTAAFAQGHNDTFAVDFKDDDVAHLTFAGDASASDSEDDEPMMTMQEEKQRMKDYTQNKKDFPTIHISGNSSSPVKAIKLNDGTNKRRAQQDTFNAKLTTIEDFDDIDSQYVNSHLNTAAQYTYDGGKEDSQNTNGATSKNSSVTGYTNARNAKATMGGSIKAGQNGKTAIAERMGRFKQNKFTTT